MLQFMADNETKLVALWRSIVPAQYQPDYATCFVKSWPVKREIFAAAYVDRVVHHWIISRIEPILEDRFKEQGDVSKNCRKGQGSLSAVRAVAELIREETDNYNTDAWIFKGDIYGFFMSIDQALLWEMIEIFVREYYHRDDIECLLYLIRITVFHRPQDHCIKKSPRSSWDGVPPNKSLFHCQQGKGLPAGNLPSQILANFYGSILDEFFIHTLKIRHIRFVDDFTCVVKDREAFLALGLPQIKQFLSQQLLVQLHPKKIYLQHYTKGVMFVGAMIMPGRIYISNRTVGGMYRKIHRYNKIAEQGMAFFYVEKFVQTMNSYFGLMIHYNSYRIRRRAFEMVAKEWFEYVYVEGDMERWKLKNDFKPKVTVRKKLRSKDWAKLITPELYEIGQN
jgi:hypothetical protein